LFLFSLVILISFVFVHMWGNIPTPHGPCPLSFDPYYNVRNCPSIRQISNDIFGHKNTSFPRLGNDRYSDSSNPTWSQQSNLSWQAQFPRNHVPQFHDHSYSYPHQQYQEKPPFRKRSALEETMSALKEKSTTLEETMATSK
jgi:hypothetical protein